MTRKDPLAFLDPQPPSDAKDAKYLFINREDELRQAKEYIEAARKRDPQRILAIVGRARVGKSHLLQLVEASVRRGFSATISVKITPGHADPRQVLREILNEVYGGLYNQALQQSIKTADGGAVLEPFERLKAIYSDAISGTAASVEVSQAQTVVESLKRRLAASFKLPGLQVLLGGLGLGLDAGRERTAGRNDSKAHKVTVNSFQKDVLGMLVGLVHELFVAERPDWTTMLIVDDFDILHRDREGSFDPVPLMQELYKLSRVAGLYVVTTAREDTFFQHRRVFVRVAHVEPFPEYEFLVEAYARRVKRFYRGEDPLDKNVVTEVAKRSEGRIGVFMEWLRDIYDDRSSGTTQPKEWFKKTWKRIERDEDEAATAVKSAATDSEGALARKDSAVVLSSSMYRFILEDYSSINSLRVDPVALSYIREDLRRRVGARPGAPSRKAPASGTHPPHPRRH